MRERTDLHLLKDRGAGGDHQAATSTAKSAVELAKNNGTTLLSRGGNAPVD
jgi:hypothetical protein